MVNPLNKILYTILTLCSLILIFGFSLRAENVYLKNGEILRGKVIDVKGGNVVLQSEIGYGYVEIPQSQILNITFPQNNRIDLARRYGIGYINKTGAISSNDKYNYKVNQLSFRTYATTDFFIDFLIGYSSSTFHNKLTSKNEDYSVFQSDVRAAVVIYRRDALVVYSGASVGAISWQDPALGLNETGPEASFFVGSEVFFSAIPDIGFSGEVAISYQKTKSLSRYDLDVTPLPTVAVHFYF